MAKERITKDTYDFTKLVVRRYLNDEHIKIKSGSNIVTGDILVQGTNGEYEKYNKVTHTNIGNIRVYVAEEEIKESEADLKIGAFRQGELNKKLVKGVEATDYNLINALEIHNIFLVEVK